MSYTVKLSYFKPSGKWYTDDEYHTEEPTLYRIWDEVRDEAQARKYLSQGFIVLVEVPDHPHNHPHIIMPQEAKPSE